MQLQQQERDLDALGIDVCVVSFERGDAAARYAENMALAWPVLVDERRLAYAAYAMDVASPWQIWGPKTWLAYARELWRGQRLKHSSADVYQRGGDVLVDPRGIVRLHHIGQGPSDRPSVQTLLRTVAQPEVNR